MGLFGPTSEELHLQSELDTTRATLAETSEELERTRESERRLLGVADSDAGTIRDLRKELADNQIANHIAAYTLDVLAKMEEAGEIDFGAEATAREVVTQRTIDQATASVTNELIDTEYARLAAEIDPATIDTIRKQLTDRMTHDGTFEGLKKEVAQDTRKKLIEELLAEARVEAEAALTAPEAKTELWTEVQADETYMQEVAKIVAQARKAALQAQRDEFKASAPELARQEVETGHDAALAAFMKEWAGTYEGSDKIAKLKRKLEKRVAEEAEAEILAATENATLKELYAKREAQLARDLEAEVLLADFTDGGIDTTTIQAGSRLELILGDTEQKDDTYYDPGYGNRRGTIGIIREKRRLNLTAEGNGKFIMNYDSLADSNSVYERNDAIAVGTVLQLGRQQIELEAITLDDRIVYGVPIFYDTDATDTTITSTELKVRAVKLNHTLAAKKAVKKIVRVDGKTEDIS